MELQHGLWQDLAMIEFRSLSDDHHDLAHSPLMHGALLVLQYAHKHGSIGLTKIKALTQKRWAALAFRVGDR